MKKMLDKALCELEMFKRKARTPTTPSSLGSTPLQTPPAKGAAHSPTEPTPANPDPSRENGTSSGAPATAAAEKPPDAEAEDCFLGYPWVVLKARTVICYWKISKVWNIIFISHQIK